MLNPETVETVGKVNIEAHVFTGSIITGAGGNTTALIVLSWHAGIRLVELASVVPQSAVSLYLAFMVQHPYVFVSNAFAEANDPYALNEPPGD